MLKGYFEVLATLALLMIPSQISANSETAVMVVYNITDNIPGYTGAPFTIKTSTLAYMDETSAQLALGNLTSCGSAQLITDVCSSSFSPCDANADCTSTGPSMAQCRCKNGFNATASTDSFLPHDIVPSGTHCPDIDECTSSPCHALANCTNTQGSFVCRCQTGYTGDGNTCTDIDECAFDTSCDVNANCTNLNGSFSCTCKTGYSGNGRSCVDIDECLLSNACPLSHHTCTNTVGSFTCGCEAGLVDNGSDCVTTTPPATTTSSGANHLVPPWRYLALISLLALTSLL